MSFDDGATWGEGYPSTLTDNNHFGCEAALIAVNMTINANNANNANTASNNKFAGNHSATRGAGSLNGGKEAAVLFFSEPTMDKRKELTLRCSLDGGSTWPGIRVINGDNPAAYSALQQLPAPPGTAKQLLVVWESGNTMIAETISVDWCVSAV